MLDSLIAPDGLTLPADESRLFIGSFADSILWQVFFSGPPFLAPADQPLAFPPYSTALLRSGKLLASDASNGEIHVIAPFPGTSDDPFSTGSPISEPRDIVVVPKKCGGRYPTIVGTNEGETIRGSKYADVISGGASRDLIKGLGGKDIICGGGAGDFVFGGGGSDRLFGEGGADRLIGGKGADVCRGGAGSDVQKTC